MKQSMFPLNDGSHIPQLGFGTWLLPEEKTAAAVSAALATGYRLIDMPSIYGNEAGVGEGMRMFHSQYDIATESWAPLGQGGALLRDEEILRIAKKHRKTAAQVVLRWHLDGGLVAIPKSANPERIRENFNVFDFRVDNEDMEFLDAIDNPQGRIGPDPNVADF
jgi:diketogulonate reductase-like aldo/keto reductase